MCVEDKIHHCRAEFNFFLKYSSLLFRCIFSFVILILAESAKYQVKRLFTTKKEVSHKRGPHNLIVPPRNPIFQKSFER